ncbi:MAG: hypothetical protein LAO04_11335 [Acidobacteriia bacterium]|nr:hypothetical protein [Terriglobia bacterium]
MKLRQILGVTIVALAFTVAIGAEARAKNSANLALYHDASLAGSHLASGTYHVRWETHTPGVTVTFQQGNKVVATVEGKVVDRGTKYTNNAVIYLENADGSRGIQETRFGGSSEVIVFKE